jgi:hypothetical protein
MTKTRSLVAAVVSIAGLTMLACGDDDDDREFAASLTAAAEVPTPTGSPTATGSAQITLDEDSILHVVVTVNGQLTSNVSLAHIHGPAAPGATANIVLDFVPSMSAVISAGTRTGRIVDVSYDLNTQPVAAGGVLRIPANDLINMLSAGTAYVNVHTTTNGAGEIRGQVARQ